MSSLARNLPVIVLAAAVAASLYLLYKQLQAVQHQVNALTREVGGALQTVKGVQQQMMAQGAAGIVASVLPTVLEMDDAVAGEQDAESVESEDIEVQDAGAPVPQTATAASESTKQSQQSRQAQQSQQTQRAQRAPKPSGEAEPGVQQYIGQLERFLQEDAHRHAEDEGAEDAAPPPAAVSQPQSNGRSAPEDHETASEFSDMSAISGLNQRKRVPPWPAKNHPVGHQEVYNGKTYEVKLTSANVVRWGRPGDE